MKAELFERIIEDAKTLDSVEFITHGGMGEPLMDEFIADRISREKSKLNARVQLHTNGTLLSEENIRKLFDAGLDILSVSLNAFYSLTHKAVTGLDFDVVRRNVEKAFELKTALNAGTDIRITMVKTDKISPKEVRDFTKYWKQFTPKIAVHPMKNWAYFMKNTVKGRRVPCKWIWYMMSIKWDGKTSICHEDFDNKAVIGDLNESKIIEVFNCEQIRELRRKHYRGEFTPSKICEDCSRTYLDRSFWTNAIAITLPSGNVKYSVSPEEDSLCREI
jgi:radical SAM protein with 4Fe4S-binding SPASM domain